MYKVHSHETMYLQYITETVNKTDGTLHS